jgi:chromosome partitioning protein
MKVISIINNKGGVGKTTTAINLAYGLKRLHKKVLCVELDGQGNLGQALHCDVDKCPSMYDLLGLGSDCRPWNEVTGVQHKKGVDIIPADKRLAVAESLLSIQRYNSDEVLNKKLEAITAKYDYIIIDTEPHLGKLTINAIFASDEVIIPVKAEPQSMVGTDSALDLVRDIAKKCKPKLRVVGLLTTLVDKRRNNEEVFDQIDDLARTYNTKRFDTTISLAASQAYACRHGEPIYDFEPKSAVARDYAAMVDEYINLQGGSI